MAGTSYYIIYGEVIFPFRFVIKFTSSFVVLPSMCIVRIANFDFPKINPRTGSTIDI